MSQENEVQVSLRVAELLCSRICHDLISPTSAVNTGLELMGESDPEIAAQAMSLVQSSAKQATKKLELFRLAFGFGGAGSAIAIHKALGLFIGIFPDGLITVQWDQSAPQAALTVSKPAARLLMNILMVAADCLPRGGAIELAFATVDAGLAVGVSATGTGASLSDERKQALGPNADEMALDARSVQAFFAAKQARALSSPLQIDQPKPGCVRLATVLPL